MDTPISDPRYGSPHRPTGGWRWDESSPAKLSGTVHTPPTLHNVIAGPTFNDEDEELLNVEVLSGMVAASIGDDDLQKSYAHVNLDDVADTNNMGLSTALGMIPSPLRPPPTIRRTSHKILSRLGQLGPSKVVNYDESSDEDDDDADSDFEDTENNPPVNSILGKRSAGASLKSPPTKHRRTSSATRFLELFVMGSMAKTPVKWTLAKMQKLADQLEVCPRFLPETVLLQLVTRDAGGFYHPTPDLINTCGSK